MLRAWAVWFVFLEIQNKNKIEKKRNKMVSFMVAASITLVWHLRDIKHTHTHFKLTNGKMHQLFYGDEFATDRLLFAETQKATT